MNVSCVSGFSGKLALLTKYALIEEKYIADGTIKGKMSKKYLRNPSVKGKLPLKS